MNFLMRFFFFSPLGVSNCLMGGYIICPFHTFVSASKPCCFCGFVFFLLLGVLESSHFPLECTVSGLLTAFLSWRHCCLEVSECSGSDHRLCSQTAWVCPLLFLRQSHTSGSLLSSSNKNIGRSNKYKDVSTLFVSLYFILIFFGGVR